MPHKITVEPSDRAFDCEPDETILMAGIRQGIGLPYGCRDGVCGSCKCKKISGSVKHLSHHPKALSDEEEAAGYVLTCRGLAQSDVVLESRQVTLAGAFPIRKMPARVATLERLTHDVMRVQLQLPASCHLQFHAGQFLDVNLRDGTQRSFSIATAPHELMQSGSPMIDLHVRHLPGGAFSDQVFSGMKEKDMLRIEGPYGSFHLRDESPKPMVMVASGTGIAPIKAIIEHMHFMAINRPAILYWGVRRPRDLYLDAWLRKRMQTMSQLNYVPVVSDATTGDNWDGRNGFVHLAALADFSDLSGHQVYTCGAPIVVDGARRDFVARAKLPEHEFFADAFTNKAAAD